MYFRTFAENKMREVVDKNVTLYHTIHFLNI